MEPETATGVLPPQGEESAEFENVNNGAAANANANANANGNANNGAAAAAANGNANNGAGTPNTANNSNTPLGDTVAPLPPPALNVAATAMNAVPAPTVTKVKKTQSAAQQKTMTSQAEERASLKSAGVPKPSVAMVATLASMRTKGDPKYNSAFANAVAGKPLNSYRTAKKGKKAKGTVINSTNGPAGVFSRNVAVNARNNSVRNTKKKGVNSGTQAYSRGTAASVQTNMRSKNVVNTTMMNGKVDAVLDIAESIGKQLGEMKRMIKTLKAKHTRGPRVTRNAVPANNSLLGLGPLPAPPGAFNVGTELSTIPEGTAGQESNNNNAFTPPP
jgi:hypothetical protein